MGPFLLVTLLAHATLDAQGTRAIDQRLSDFVWAAFDTARGGFVSRAGVPEESAVELAIERGDGPWMSRATTTLDWTHGLMDTLIGGFYTNRSTRHEDEDVLLKRTDVNARRLENLTDAWQLTHDERFHQDAARVVDFMERVLMDGRGGFVVAQVGDRDLEPRSNGLAIHAWLVWAATTRSTSRRDFALRSLDRVWENCWTPPLGLVRKDDFGDLSLEPQLVDQVEMGRAYVLAARLCGGPRIGRARSRLDSSSPPASRSTTADSARNRCRRRTARSRRRPSRRSRTPAPPVSWPSSPRSLRMRA
jgi:hypothetical protein